MKTYDYSPPAVVDIYDPNGELIGIFDNVAFMAQEIETSEKEIRRCVRIATKFGRYLNQSGYLFVKHKEEYANV